ASHLVLSVGGNDALDYNGLILHESAGSFAEVLSQLAGIQSEFQQNYKQVLQRLSSHEKPLAVCTVYDAIPGLSAAEATGLCLFNDVILREASAAQVPIIDLRHLCAQPRDYSAVSPIEPSAAGGDKIARAIARVVTGHDFGRRQTVVYT